MVLSGSSGRQPLPTDEELMLLTAKGDLAAFEEIVRRHQHSAWNIAYRFLGRNEEAKDVVQDAFLKIFEAAPRYQPKAAFKTYLYCVISRLCLDQAKRKQLKLTDTLPQDTSLEPSADERLLLEERDRLLWASLKALPPKQRMAVILRFYEDLSYREIAQAMQITEKAVERLLARARDSLQATLLPLLKK